MLKDTIRDVIEPVISSEQMELVDIECLKMNTRWLVKLYLDKDGGVTLDDCQKVSYLIGDILDVHELPPGPYTLEVSSPGLDRPLTRDKDFLRFKGENISIRTSEKIEGSRNFHGKLLDYVVEENLSLVVLDTNGSITRIPREKIAKAHLEADRGPIPRSPLHGKRTNQKKA